MLNREEDREQEEPDGDYHHVEEEVNHAVAYDITKAQLGYPQERYGPEGLNHIRDHVSPSIRNDRHRHADTKLLGRLHDIGGFDDSGIRNPPGAPTRTGRGKSLKQQVILLFTWRFDTNLLGVFPFRGEAHSFG